MNIEQGRQAVVEEYRAKVAERKNVLNKAHTRWYDIRDAVDVAEVRIYDEIGLPGVSADQFVSELRAIAAPEIRVAINSPGGDAFDGIAIYNALRAHPAKIITRVDALAASAASIIAQAGDVRQMFPSSQMVIHDAWGMAIGNASEMRALADILDAGSDIIADIYAERSGGDAEAFRALMQKDTWLKASESVDLGLADEVIEPGAQAEVAKRTLNDEIAETMDVVAGLIESAERVAALRAEKGKDLSEINRESLEGLEREMGRLGAVLKKADLEPEPAPDTETGDEERSLQLQRQLAVLEARQRSLEQFAALIDN